MQMQKVLGRAFTTAMQANRLAPSSNPIASAQCNLEAGENTVQFSVEPPVDGFGSATLALLQWKVGGMPLRRVCSVYSGAAISGVAEALDIQIQDVSGAFPTPVISGCTVTNGSPFLVTPTAETLAAGTVISVASQPGVTYTVSQTTTGTMIPLSTPYTGLSATPVVATIRQAPYSVTATIERGTRPTTSQPPILVPGPAQVVAPGASINVPILQDSGVISVQVLAYGTTGALADTDIVVTQDSATNNILSGYYPFTQTGFQPVSPGSVILVIGNRNVSISALCSVTFGVEG